MLTKTQRGYFAQALHDEMKNKDIYLISVGLGYGMFDDIKKDYPEQFIQTEASEQAAMGIAVGLALSGKIPFIYSISSFLLNRPYEWIRNYLNYENIPVKLVGGGRDKEYSEDGITHWAEDTKYILGNMENIVQFWPTDKEQIKEMVHTMVINNQPCFISLSRIL